MQTSLAHNRKYKFYKVIGYSLGAIIGIAGTLFTGISGVPMLACIIATTGACGKIADHLCNDSRGYPFQGRDEFLQNIRKHTFKDGKILRLNMEFLQRYIPKIIDMNLLYHPDGNVSLGFRFLPHESKKDLKEYLRLAAEKILRETPPRALIQFVKVSTPIRHKSITQERSALVKNGLKEKTYFVFVTLHRSEKIIESLPSILEEYAVQINQDEMQTYHAFLALPEDGLSPDKDKTPMWEVNSSVSSNRIHPHQNSKCYGSVSLVGLPSQTSFDFNDIFKDAEAVDGIICTSFKKIKRFSKDIESYRIREEIKKTSDKKISEIALAEIQHEDELEAKGLKASMAMSQTILLYGEPEEVSDAIRSMTTGIKQERIKERGIYIENINRMEQALKSCKIGEFGVFPMGSRTLFIGNILEAMTYLPKLTFPTPQIPFLGLILRDTDNSPSFIDHRGNDDKPAIMVLGESGSGKSAFVSSIIRAHECLGRDLQIDTAIFILDIGSSYTWFDPECDLIFRLSKTGLSMPIYPLQIFQPLESASDEEKQNCIDLCTQFILTIINSKEEPEVVEVINSSVQSVIEAKEALRFIRLYEKIKENLTTQNIEFSERWKNIVSSIKQLSQGGAYGHIFDPEHLPMSKYKLDHRYISKIQFDLADKEAPNEIANIFFQLAYAASQFYSAKFDSKAKTSRNLLAIFDEFDGQAKKLGSKAYEQASILVNQARKSGMIPVFASQDASHFMSTETESKEKQSEIFQGLGHIFFYNFNINESLAIAISKSNQYKDFEHKVREISEQINNDRNGKKTIYSIGHIDKARRISKKHPDLEDDFLWRITTTSGGLQIKYELARKLKKWKPEEIHKRLAENKIKIEANEINRESINHICNRILGI